MLRETSDDEEIRLGGAGLWMDEATSRSLLYQLQSQARGELEGRSDGESEPVNLSFTFRQLFATSNQ